jgi:hypothetical protein
MLPNGLPLLCVTSKFYQNLLNADFGFLKQNGMILIIFYFNYGSFYSTF